VVLSLEVHPKRVCPLMQMQKDELSAIILKQCETGSHAGMVVPECFKYDNASQWQSEKFDPQSLKNP